MRHYDDGIVAWTMKILAYIAAWLASWKLADVQQLAGIFSAVCVGFVALVNGYVVWKNRDRVHGRRDDS